jgi:hypothetical protein
LNKRPLAIAIIGWVFIAVGSFALFYHLQPRHIPEFRADPSIANRLIWICLIRFLAIVGGVFVLRGANWARWLLVLWLAYHVGLSAFHSLFEVAVHGGLFAVILYFLFRTPANEFFHHTPLHVEGAPAKDGTRSQEQ